MISNIIYSFNLLIWSKHVLSNFFLIIFFCLNGFKDHPTSVDKDKLRKSTNPKGLCLSTWIMSMLIGQILHFKEAEGWTISNHAHTNVSQEKVKSLFLIKHLTPGKRDTPWSSLFFKRSEFDDARKTSGSKCDNLFYFLPLIFAKTVYSYEVRCMIWIKKTMYMPIWIKTTIAMQVCAQEALTHLYVDAINEHHAWYSTNWKTYMRCNACASRGIYSHVWWWNVIQLFGNTMHDMQSDIMKCMNAEWHNEMHECKVT